MASPAAASRIDCIPVSAEIEASTGLMRSKISSGVARAVDLVAAGRAADSNPSKRLGLLAIGDQPLANHFGSVVGAAAAGQAGDNLLLGHLQFQDDVQRSAPFGQSIASRASAWAIVRGKPSSR